MDLKQTVPRDLKRLERQFLAFERSFPFLRKPMTLIRSRGWWIVRIPIAVIFVFAGMLSFLPILGFWMLPMGLLLLAIDLPIMRGPTSNAIIRGRRRFNVWKHRRSREKG